MATIKENFEKAKGFCREHAQEIVGAGIGMIGVAIGFNAGRKFGHGEAGEYMWGVLTEDEEVATKALALFNKRQLTYNKLHALK